MRMNVINTPLVVWEEESNVCLFLKPESHIFWIMLFFRFLMMMIRMLMVLFLVLFISGRRETRVRRLFSSSLFFSSVPLLLFLFWWGFWCLSRDDHQWGSSRLMICILLQLHQDLNSSSLLIMFCVLQLNLVQGSPLCPFRIFRTHDQHQPHHHHPVHFVPMMLQHVVVSTKTNRTEHELKESLPQEMMILILIYILILWVRTQGGISYSDDGGLLFFRRGSFYYPNIPLRNPEAHP